MQIKFYSTATPLLAASHIPAKKRKPFRSGFRLTGMAGKVFAEGAGMVWTEGIGGRPSPPSLPVARAWR